MCKTITARQNPKIKKCIKLLASSKYRKQEGLFVLEGARLCYDAMLHNATITDLFYTNIAYKKYCKVIDEIKSSCLNSYTVSDDLMSDISATETSQGIICLCKIQDNKLSLETLEQSNYLGLENIQDPSNLGTILRTAAALDFSNIIISNDSCDIYSPKVLRGSMGAIFKIKFMYTSNMEDIVDKFNSNGFNTYATVVEKDALDIRKANFAKNSLVIIGNEGKGIKLNTIKACKEKITIPMNKNTESLNVAMATGITIWEMMK